MRRESVDDDDEEEDEEEDDVQTTTSLEVVGLGVAVALLVGAVETAIAVAVLLMAV